MLNPITDSHDIALNVDRGDGSKLWKLIDERNKALALLERASGKLQDYCTEINGDLNDSLSTEIDGFLQG